MKVALIGAGNLMTNLGKALKSAEDIEIVQVWSRTEASAQSLASILNTGYTNDVSSVLEADVYIIAVKDNALESLIPPLAAKHPNSVFFHTAGSMPMDVFESYAKHYGVFYPLQTFSKNKVVNFKEIPVFIEANDEKSSILLKLLAKSVSDHIFELSSERRKYLHLAAVFACNFTNHCYDLAAHILEPKGIPFSVMLPLIDETARKVHELSPHDAQTGPAVRYDENVMNRQIALLEDENTKQIYKILSQSIHDKL